MWDKISKKFDLFIIISNFFDTKELRIGAVSELDLGLSSKCWKTLQLTWWKISYFSDIKNKKYENKIFKETSAEVALNIYNYTKRKVIFINILGKSNSNNYENIGIFPSGVYVALDKANFDFVYYGKNKDMIKRMEDFDEKNLIDWVEKIGFGKTDYELIMIS